MKSIEVEVMTQHYMGSVRIERKEENDLLFYIYIKNGFLGRLLSIINHKKRLWYSPEINDKELKLQIGEWIEHSYTLPNIN